MPAPKGHPRYGGRLRGTPNKKTLELKEGIELRLGKPLHEAMLDLFEESTAAEKGLKFAILKELFQYVYPKRKAVEIIESEDDSKIDQAKELLQMKDKQLLAAMRERLKLIAGESV